MAEIIENEEDSDEKRTVHLEKGESALIFANEGIYQILSESFKDALALAQETQGKSMMDALDNCKKEDAVKVLNDFVLLQLVNLLSEIIQNLEANRKN